MRDKWLIIYTQPVGSYSYNGRYTVRKDCMKLALNLADMINHTISALKSIQVSNNSMARAVIWDRIAIDFLFVGQDET